MSAGVPLEGFHPMRSTLNLYLEVQYSLWPLTNLIHCFEIFMSYTFLTQFLVSGHFSDISAYRTHFLLGPALFSIPDKLHTPSSVGWTPLPVLIGQLDSVGSVCTYIVCPYWLGCPACRHGTETRALHLSRRSSSYNLACI